MILSRGVMSAGYARNGIGFAEHYLWMRTIASDTLGQGCPIRRSHDIHLHYDVCLSIDVQESQSDV